MPANKATRAGEKNMLDAEQEIAWPLKATLMARHSDRSTQGEASKSQGRAIAWLKTVGS
jgi:hypothetical protein